MFEFTAEKSYISDQEKGEIQKSKLVTSMSRDKWWLMIKVVTKKTLLKWKQRHLVQSTEHRVQSTECRVQSAAYRLKIAECRVQSAEYSVQSTEYRAQSIDFVSNLICW